MSDSILQALKQEIPIISVTYEVKTKDGHYEGDRLKRALNNQSGYPHSNFLFALRRIAPHLDTFNQSLVGKTQVFRFELSKYANKLENCKTLFGKSFKDVKHGIYFCVRVIPSFFDTEEVVYVGKTKDLHQRFTQHHKMSFFRMLRVSRIYFIEYNRDLYSEDELCSAEQKYIDLLHPVLNRSPEDRRIDEAFDKGFATAKKQMMDFFDSAIQPPKLK